MEEVEWKNYKIVLYYIRSKGNVREMEKNLRKRRLPAMRSRSNELKESAKVKYTQRKENDEKDNTKKFRGDLKVLVKRVEQKN